MVEQVMVYFFLQEIHKQYFASLNQSPKYTSQPVTSHAGSQGFNIPAMLKGLIQN